MTNTTNTPTKRLTEEAIAARHQHIVEGTLRFDPIANKQKITIRTRNQHGLFDGNTREIATSDLHQCFWTAETKAAMDRAKRNAKARGKRASTSEEIVILEDAEFAALTDRNKALAEAIG